MGCGRWASRFTVSHSTLAVLLTASPVAPAAESCLVCLIRAGFSPPSNGVDHSRVRGDGWFVFVRFSITPGLWFFGALTGLFHYDCFGLCLRLGHLGWAWFRSEDVPALPIRLMLTSSPQELWCKGGRLVRASVCIAGAPSTLWFKSRTMCSYVLCITVEVLETFPFGLFF